MFQIRLRREHSLRKKLTIVKLSTCYVVQNDTSGKNTLLDEL